MPSQSENRALYSIQVIHTQKDSQLMNSASGVKKKNLYCCRKSLLELNLQAFLLEHEN